MIATLWLPSLDPVGPASVFAAMVAAVCWISAELPVLRRLQIHAIVGSAGFLLGCVLVSDAPVVFHPPLDLTHKTFRCFPSLDDYLGNWIVLSVGLVLSLKLLRRRARGAVALTILFGLLIAGELVGHLYWRYAGEP